MNFFDPKPEYQECKEAIDQAMQNIAEQGAFIMGPAVREFESAVATYLSPEEDLFAVSVSSGTDALLLSLLAAGVGPGDEVITTPFTFIATAETIVQAGAKPVFVDIDPLTFNMDVSQLESAITPLTKAVIPVHLFGLATEMDPLLDIAGRHNLKVIEDVAQSMGSSYRDQMLGTIGDFACFSFFPSKNLGGFGDAGLVTCKNEADAQRLRALRVHGSSVKYEHSILGYNARMDTLQAAILNVKLKKLDQWLAQRQSNARKYCEAWASLSNVQLPIAPEHMTHTYNQFSIVVDDRDGLAAFLKEKAIPSMVYYPKPLHQQEVFKNLNCFAEGSFPHSETLSKTILSLPIYPYMSEDEQDHVINAVKEFLCIRS